MSKSIKINIIEDGPFHISGQEDIVYCGKSLGKSDDAYLCRCGESKKAPFCEGAHSDCGFSGKNDEPMEEKDIRVWEGINIKTAFNQNICMHVYYCKPLNALREKNLAGDLATADEIANVVKRCPSGALTFEYINQEGDTSFKDDKVIEIMEGGEIRVKTEVECSDLKLWENQPKNRMTLCRCGMSKNKPYCDGLHKKKKDFK